MTLQPLHRVGLALEVAGRRVSLEALTLCYGLDCSAEAEVVLAEPPPPVKIGTPVMVRVGTLRFPLEVDDFYLPRGRRGGRLSLRDAVERALPYNLEVFSGPRGASLGDAIRKRVTIRQAPPELFRKEPNVIVDATLHDLLEQACAVRPGWHFRWTAKGLEIGPFQVPVCPANLEDVAYVPAGVEAFVTSAPLPAAGAPVTARDVEGVLLSAEVFFHQAGELTCKATIGPAAALLAHEDRAVRELPATVKKRKPLLIEIETSGRKQDVRALHMNRKSGKGRYKETLPLDVGDTGIAVVPVCGITTRLVRFFSWAELPAAKAYVLEAEERIDRVKNYRLTAAKVKQTADEIRLTADTIEARVKQFDINERRGRGAAAARRDADETGASEPADGRLAGAVQLPRSRSRGPVDH